MAESRHVSQVWTMVGEAAEREAVRAARPLGDPRAITADDLWARIAERMSEKPYKPLGMDLLEQVRRNQQQATAGFTAGCERIQRLGVGRDLAAAVQVQRGDEVAVTTAATHLGSLARAVKTQHNSLDVLMKNAVVQLDRLNRVLDGQARRAGEAIVACWQPTKPVTSEVTWKSNPSPGF